MSVVVHSRMYPSMFDRPRGYCPIWAGPVMWRRLGYCSRSVATAYFRGPNRMDHVVGRLFAHLSDPPSHDLFPGRPSSRAI